MEGKYYMSKMNKVRLFVVTRSTSIKAMRFIKLYNQFERYTVITCLLQYGVPLDNRADFTKTDWEMWVAAMEDDTVVCTL